MNKTQMYRVIDSICRRGCRYVNTLLADAEERRRCKELQALDTDQQRGVIKELKTVMSVYDKSGSCKN
jgi:hypothetical protein